MKKRGTIWPSSHRNKPAIGLETDNETIYSNTVKAPAIKESEKLMPTCQKAYVWIMPLTESWKT